mmetsp:Transcript_375/g.723  ORF Transcript_375/g.723 Transcript_375/m.723 type:complete len:290 (-) Transcript_375:170-1039(-)
MPDNMPESFYEMLEGSLAYRHKQRMDAGQLMKGEFSQFHIHHKEQEQGGTPGTISIHEIAAEAAGDFGDTVPEMASASGSLSIRKKTRSVVLEGSVNRHNAYLGYIKFERSVTTVLATMLAKDTCKSFLLLLRGQHQKVEEIECVYSGESVTKANAEKLQVVTIKVLLELLGDMQVQDGREVKEVIAMIQALKNFHMYENFAYHISLLRQFVSIHTRNNGGKGADGDDDAQISSVHGNNVWSSLKKKRGLGGSGHGGDRDSSTKSANNFKGTGSMRRISSATGVLSAMA